LTAPLGRRNRGEKKVTLSVLLTKKALHTWRVLKARRQEVEPRGEKKKGPSRIAIPSCNEANREREMRRLPGRNAHIQGVSPLRKRESRAQD